MSGALSGSADPNIARSAPPPEEHFIYPDAQGGSQHRAELNMTKQNSIDQAIASGFALGGKQYGRDETKASQPALEFPVWSLRSNVGRDDTVDTNWQQQRDDLAEGLPKQLLNDPAFADFLKVVAKAMGWLQAAAAPYDVNSPAVNNIANGHQIVQDSILATLVQAETVLHQGDLFLKSVGAGHPEFDTLSRLLTDVKGLFNKLSSITRRYQENSIDSDDKRQLKALMQQLQAILSQMSSTASTSELRILIPTLNNMQMTTQLLLREPGEQLPEITTALSTVGLSTGGDALIGAQLNALSTGVASQIPDVNPQLLTIALGILLTAGAYIMQTVPPEAEGRQ